MATDELDGQDQVTSGENWFVVLDLSGSREQYTALFDFLARLGARKIAANTWWFVDAEPQRFDEYCDELWSLLMSAAPNQPFLKDKLFVFQRGRGEFVGGPARDLIDVGFAEPAEGISEQSTIIHKLVTKSYDELRAEGKIVEQ